MFIASLFAKAGYFTEVAQLVEYWSPKPGVGSSSLSFRAKIYRFDEKSNSLY